MTHAAHASLLATQLRVLSAGKLTMRAGKVFLPLFIITVTFALDVKARHRPSFTLGQLQPQPKDEPWNPELTLETIETYIAWGSLGGALTPNCSRFDAIFFEKRTWVGPFAVPNGYVVSDIEESCTELAENISWHGGSLEAGSYIYPFYYEQSTRPYKVGFVWTAVGASNYREIFGLKNYDFTIISSLQFYNDTAIFMAYDFFWPESKNEVPDSITTMIEQYMSLMDGDCKTFPQMFWKDDGAISPSGSKQDFFGLKGVTAYCDMMMYEWSSYVYHLHHVTYSVSRNEDVNVVDKVFFTWTRTGLHLGVVRTDEVLSELSLLADDDSPLKALKIAVAYDYFQPHGMKT